MYCFLHNKGKKHLNAISKFGQSCSEKDRDAPSFLSETVQGQMFALPVVLEQSLQLKKKGKGKNFQTPLHLTPCHPLSDTQMEGDPAAAGNGFQSSMFDQHIYVSLHSMLSGESLRCFLTTNTEQAPLLFSPWIHTDILGTHSVCILFRFAWKIII